MKFPGKLLEIVSVSPGSGYGDAAAEYALGLANCGVDVSWRPFRNKPHELTWRQGFQKDVRGSLRQHLPRPYKRRPKPDVLLLMIPPGQWHSLLLTSTTATQRYAYVAWELAAIPPSWPAILNAFDGIFVPCQFNADALIAGGVDIPVRVVPHVARHIERQPKTILELPVPAHHALFYTIGTWTSRKSMEETVRAYLEAFTVDDSVTLVIRTDPIDEIASRRKNIGEWPAYSVAWTLAQILAQYPRAAAVHLMSQRLAPEEIDALHRQCDCFISLTRSEGWGLGAFDALLHDNPVIITGYGGQLDYLGQDYPLRVRFDLELVGNSEPDWHFIGLEHAQWAKADRHHAAQLMRGVYKSPAKGRQMAADLGAALRSRFSADTVCTGFGQALGVLP